MSNALVMYFVECPSIRIIPELSPPIRKGQNLLIFYSPNATTSSRRIQYFNFFFFPGGRQQVLAIFWAVYLDSWMGRELLFCIQSSRYCPHLCCSERASARLTSSSILQMSPWGCSRLWFPLLLLSSSLKSIFQKFVVENFHLQILLPNLIFVVAGSVCSIFIPFLLSFLLFKIFIGVRLLYSVVSSCCTAICIHMSLFFGFPSDLGHQRALSRVPCAIQQVLTGVIHMSIPTS